MLEGRSIICFAHDWEGDPTSKTHLMRILARRNRILWVNSVGMRRPTATRRDLRRLLAKGGRALRRPRAALPNLLVADPPALPLPGVPAVDRLNAWLLAAWLRRLCRRHDLRRPILWTFLPNVVGLLGRLDPALVVYHCVDEYSEFAGAPRAALREMEQALARRADLVLASSERLAAERRPLNPRTHFVSHGVDVEHFRAALRLAPPADLAALPRPVVGFVGLLAEWVDLGLLAAVARRLPHASVALIGRATTDLGPLAGLPNVHRLGPRPYAALPACCAGFDVGVIPFRLNALTTRANPLKLREYLAAGLPVVSTPLPEVARYDGLVRLAEGEDAFVAAVEAALADRSPAATRRRTEAMAAESWERRAEEISALVAGAMEPGRPLGPRTARSAA